MSTTQYTTIGGGLIQYDKRSLRRYFHKQNPSASKKRFTFNRLDVKNFRSMSNLSEAADAWNLLSSGSKDDWGIAGIVCGLSAYNLFQQDKIYRILNSIVGNAVPNFYHQYKVGKIIVPVSGAHFLLRQTNNQVFTFPANLTISRHAILTSTNGGGQYIKVRFSYYYDEGGGVTKQTEEISLDLASEWDSETIPITDHEGLTGLSELEIEGNLVTGSFNFDNFYVETPEGIVNKDYSCTKIESSYRGLVLPTGLTYASVYPPDSES
jgi:hypothetical protein